MSRKLFCMVVAMIFVVAVVMAVQAVAGTIRVDIGGKGEVAIYPVGEPEGVGYRLYGRYGGGYVTYDDVLSPDLAAWLAENAKNGTVKKTKQGIASFGGLEEGLYLIVQCGKRDGYAMFAPFLVSVPWDGDLWEVDAKPKMEQETAETPQTGDGLIISVGILLTSAAGLSFCWLRRKKY